MSIKTPITIAYGDGIGPEIMRATLKILQAAQAQIEIHEIEVGKKIYLDGNTTGIPDSAWEVLAQDKVLLKSPITTPQGGGYKSLNVTLRKTLGLFANVRPCIAYAPYVPTKFPQVNLVIVRENEEDLYTGIEHRQTEDVYQCLKLISRPGCEQIIRYAFEYAQKFNRKKVTCLSKDNIMKMTDGLFHRTFNEVAQEYPDITHEHLIVDIGTALIATNPERFDVIVTENLYGDIISDVAAQVTGSVGLAGSANIGNQMAMFEAIHGSAPDIAGKDIANPSGLLHAATLMLVHIDQPQVATRIENAWLRTLEDGIHTADIYSMNYSKQKVGTQEFADAVIERLDLKPLHLPKADYQPGAYEKIACYSVPQARESKKVLVGVDIFLDNVDNIPIAEIGAKLSALSNTSCLKLIIIMSRGLKMWPNSNIDTPYIQHCECRFQSTENVQALEEVFFEDVLYLLEKINQLGFDIIKIENLYTFDGEIGFSLAQGQ
jgi:isocitrate dehydrogenase